MERQRFSGWLLVALAAGLRLAPLTGLGQADGFLASAEALLSGIESRYPGSPGNLELEGRVAARFAASGFAHGAVTFEAPTFIPGATSLVLGDDRRVALAPMHPTLLRPGNFPESSFDARLLYLGTGGVADLKAVRGLELKGVIAVMEFDCGDAWLRLLRFGVRGFVFLAPETFDRIEAELKVPDTEVAVPRFLAAAAASAMLRERLVGPAGRSALAVRVEAQPSVWENRKLRDLWAFIPGRDADLERTVVLFVAPMDANCVVPGQAAGGSAALNLSLLLDLLEQFRATPPAQSVMLVAVNAHTQGYLGERMLAWHLLASSGAVEDIRSAISRDIREQEIMLAQYERIDFDDPAAQAEGVLIEFRRLEDRSTGRSVKIKNPVVAYAKRDVNRVKGKMLELQSNGDLTEDKLAARVAALKATLQEHINVLTLFNKVGIKTELSKLTPAEQVIVRGYIGTVRANFATWLKLNREALGGRAVRLVIALDLSWHDRRMGFLSDGTGWSTRLGKNTVRIAADVAGETASPLLDTMSNVGGLGEGYYFPTTQSGLEPFSGTNTPGVSLRTAFDVATTAFTPADTLDAFDATRVQETADFLSAFFPALLADPKVTTVSELPSPKANPVWSVQIRTFKFDEFAASVLPELPVPGVLLQVARQSNPAAPALHRPFWGLGVVNRFFTLGDERATSVVYGLTSSTRAPTVAYRLDETFTHVDHTLDAGDVQEKVDSNLVPAIARTFALFECEEFPILNREDPSLISFSPITVPKYLILDARQDSAPRKYGIAGIQSGFSSKLMPLPPMTSESSTGIVWRPCEGSATNWLTIIWLGGRSMPTYWWRRAGTGITWRT